MSFQSALLANPETTREFVALIHVICDDMAVAFSANDVNRSLADAELGAESMSNNQLLNRVGEPLGIQFRSMEGSFSELVLATTAGKPLLVRGSEGMGGGKSGYFAVRQKRAMGRLRVFSNGQTRSYTQRSLKRQAHRNEVGNYQWHLPQSSLAFESASAFNFRSGTKEQPLKPFARLLLLFRAETEDIRSVAIFSIVMGLLSLTLPLAVEAIVNTIAFGRYLQPLLVLSLIVFVFLAFRAALGVLTNVVVEYIQRRLFVRFVDDLVSRLLRVPLVQLKKYNGPELVNRFFDVVTVQKVTAKLLLDTLMLFIQTIVGLTLLAFYHPFLLGYDIGLIFMMSVVLTIMGRGAVKTAIDESAIKYQTAAWLQQVVLHPLTFRFGDAMGFAVHRADELSSDFVHARERHFRIVLRQYEFSMMMQTIAATVLLGLGGYLVIEKQITLGQLVAGELIVTVILGSFAKIATDLESFYDLLAAVDKIGKLLDLPVDTGDKLHLVRRPGPAGVKLVGLQFKSDSEQLNLEVRPGNVLAITGRTSAGKSKLIEILAGQYPATSGYVLLNDSRVDSTSFESLQSQVGYVREVAIFEGTVDENIRVGRSAVSSERLSEMLEQLDLQDHVSELSEGLNTRLHVSGYPLSTGVAIRLTLARALAARPSVLFIDGLIDALSDDEIEALLHRLERFKAETTIVISTGRLVIENWADQRLKLGETRGNVELGT